MKLTVLKRLIIILALALSTFSLYACSEQDNEIEGEEAPGLEEADEEDDEVDEDD